VNTSINDGTNWSAAPNSPFTTSFSAINTYVLITITINNASVNKIQIYRTAGTIYVDNFNTTAYAGSSPTLTLANATTAVSASSICASTTAVPIHAFNITGSNGGGTLTNFTFTTSGSYLTGDISNFKILYNTSNTISGATTLATLSSPGNAGIKTFTAFSQAIGNATGYFWITMDVASGATNAGTITVSASASSDMTTNIKSNSKLFGWKCSNSLFNSNIGSNKSNNRNWSLVISFWYRNNYNFISL